MEVVRLGALQDMGRWMQNTFLLMQIENKDQ
jgi:hypothetical protein